MKKTTAILIALALLLIVPPPFPRVRGQDKGAPANKFRPSPDPVPGQYIVVLDEAPPPADAKGG